jgi:O-antigen/teichoic acid export membrane protein
MTENIAKRVLLVLTMGLLVGLLLIFNILLGYFIIGYGAIYTGIITILFTMYIVLKLHKVYLKNEMTFLNTLILGLPVFAIGTIFSFLLSDYDYKGTYYANGYFFHVMEETGKQFIPITLFFALVFTPTYRFVRRRLIGNPN